MPTRSYRSRTRTNAFWYSFFETSPAESLDEAIVNTALDKVTAQYGSLLSNLSDEIAEAMIIAAALAAHAALSARDALSANVVDPQQVRQAYHDADARTPQLAAWVKRQVLEIDVDQTRFYALLPAVATNLQEELEDAHNSEIGAALLAGFVAGWQACADPERLIFTSEADA